MPVAEIKKTLKDFGLREKEIRVYLGVLRSGEATVSELARMIKVKRTTIYVVAERLLKKGILGAYKAKYGTHYIATEPKELLERHKDIRADLKAIIPQLEALEKKELYEPCIKLFRGKKGYRSVANDSLKGYSHEVLYLGSAKHLNDIIGNKYVLKKYIPSRLKRKIKFRQLVFADRFSKNQKTRDQKEMRETKFLTKDFPFEANMLIYKDKVANFSTRKELISVLIESKDIAKMERAKFELLWERL